MYINKDHKILVRGQWIESYLYKTSNTAWIVVWVSVLCVFILLLSLSGKSEVSENAVIPIETPEMPLRVTNPPLFGNYLPDTPDKVDRLLEAIYRAENSIKYPYGIKSIPIKGDTQDERERYARRICKRTIKNNITRFGRFSNAQQTKNDVSYLKFLQSRYCPTTGNLSQSEKELNGNWLKNVKFYLSKENL